MSDLIYPGRVVTLGEDDYEIVSAICAALESFGFEIRGTQTEFDTNLVSMIKAFQSKKTDALGNALKVDGIIGPKTWQALFPAPQDRARPESLGAAALDVAKHEVGTCEDPLGSNSGLRVNEYLASVGLKPGFFWCMAFVYFCFQKASTDCSENNPFPRTGGCIDAWNRVQRSSPDRTLTRDAAIANPALIRPGMVFVHDYDGKHGHTGFVRTTTGDALRTIEGNADPTGGRNGVAVLEVNKRKVTDRSLIGFINF